MSGPQPFAHVRGRLSGPRRRAGEAAERAGERLRHRRSRRSAPAGMMVGPSSPNGRGRPPKRVTSVGSSPTGGTRSGPARRPRRRGAAGPSPAAPPPSPRRSAAFSPHLPAAPSPLVGAAGPASRPAQRPLFPGGPGRGGPATAAPGPSRLPSVIGGEAERRGNGAARDPSEIGAGGFV